MKRIDPSHKHFLLVPIFLLYLLFAMGTERAYAQTVYKRSTEGELGKRGAVYFLPKSRFHVTFLVEAERYEPGPYARYAPFFIGRIYSEIPYSRYRILSCQARSIGLPDPEQQYQVELRTGHPESYISTTQDGRLVGINTVCTPSSPHNIGSTTESGALSGAISLRPFFWPEPNLPQSYALATSSAKRAEIAAQQLFEMRKIYTRLISDHGENSSMGHNDPTFTAEELKKEIAALETLFQGITLIDTLRYESFIDPMPQSESGLVARFSPTEGIMPANSPIGDKVTYRLVPLQQASPEQRGQRGNRLKGIVYNVPGLYEITIEWRGKQLLTAHLPATQLGSRASLAERIGRARGGALLVSFDPNTGALLSIQQEKSETK